MGTHPIFESDFDCLTEGMLKSVRRVVAPQRSLSLSTQTLLFRAQNKSHSAEIGKTKDQLIYKIQVHEVKPHCQEEYDDLAGKLYTKLHKEDALPQKLVGSFRVIYGKQDEVIHIWRYDGGYASIKQAAEMVAQMPDYREYQKQRAHQIHRRRNELLVQFIDWPNPNPRSEGGNIYEMRTYKLRSGSAMGEWHHSWRTYGLKCRDPSTLVTGMFTNAGEINTVHHFWCYKDVEQRNLIRDQSWGHAEWATHINRTTPLVRNMESRLMKPLPWSPLQ